MKTLYLTKSGGTTDLSAYSTTAEANALYAPITTPRPNYIINGNMEANQRGGQTGVSGTTSVYASDRFKWVVSTDATVDVGTSVTAITGVPFDKFLEVDVTTADTSISAAQYAGFVYFMEGKDSGSLRFGTTDAETITISFWHAHTKTGTHSGSLRNSDNSRAYVFEYTQSVANTWEKAEITIAGDTSGTWLTGNNVGLKIHLASAVGSNYTTTAGSWGSTSYLGSTGQVNNLDSVSNFMRFGNVKLEVGSEATDYPMETYAETLARCQRYYVYIGDSVNSASGTMQSSTTANMLLPLPVEMRTTPTLTTVAANHRLRQNGVNLTPSAISIVENTPQGVTLSVTVTGGTQYEACGLRSNGVPIALNAELG